MAPTMLVEKLRYVHEDLDRHGNVRIYFWRGKGHPKTRIRAAPGTSEFRAAYDAALAAAPSGVPASKGASVRTPAAGTFRWLCVQYFGSGEFKQLDPGTQRVRRAILEHVFAERIAPGAADSYADVPLPHFTPRAVRVLCDPKADLPEAANGGVKAIRQVFAWTLQAEPESVSGAQGATCRT